MKNYTQLLSHLFILLFFLFTATFAELRAQNAFITNSLSATVTVVNVNTGAFVATIPVGVAPSGVAVSSDGQRIYVANSGAASISVIDGNTNTVIATIGVGVAPIGLALTPDNGALYVANYLSNSVSPINTTTLTAGAPIALAPNTNPWGVVVTPDGAKVYVTNSGTNRVSVISTATNTVTGDIVVGNTPYGIAVRSDGERVYVANSGSNTVSVILTIADVVIKTVDVGTQPYGLAVSPVSNQLFVTNFGSDNVSVINTTNNDILSTFTAKANPFDPMPVNPTGISVSVEGSRVLIANSNQNKVFVANATTYGFISLLDVGNVPIAFGNFTAPLLGSFPVELTSFGAIYEAGQVKLNWTTASELNNAEFEVQRSADGQLFESIGSVPGSGTTQAPQTYRFSDWDPIPDQNYYRLKQIDFDGQFTYSPIVEARVSDTGIPVLSLGPNPASEQIDLNWGISYPYAILSVYDATGRLHIRKEASQQAYARMDIGHLAPGLYTVALNVGQESASKRLLIQR